MYLRNFDTVTLFIELRSYGRDKRGGQAIALFDGLDEFFDPLLREEVTTDIHRFTNDFPQVQLSPASLQIGLVSGCQNYSSKLEGRPGNLHLGQRTSREG